MSAHRVELPGLIFTVYADGSVRIQSTEKMADLDEVIEVLKAMRKRHQKAAR